MTPVVARASAVALASLCTAIGAASAHSAGAARNLAVNVDHASISTKLGHDFLVRSTITNRGDTAADDLIAHLNVLSLRAGVYVDPEDWSSNRTRYLPPIAASGSTTLAWKMKAVNAGSFGVYVAVLPRSGSPRPPFTGPTIYVTVGERKTLDSGGIMSVALGVPALLAAVWVTVRFQRGRRSRTAGSRRITVQPPH